jgi:hypothetical protein
MEGWRQRRPGSNKKPLTRKRKTSLTLTGLLMEGLGKVNQHRLLTTTFSSTLCGLMMPHEAQHVFNDFVQWLKGRKVEAAELFLNSLRLCVEGQFGEDTGLFLWFDPVWQLGGPKGVLVGSRQAQAEDRDVRSALNLLVQQLLGQEVEHVSVDALTTDIDVRFSNGYWVRTFVSDPTADMNWYFRDRQRKLTITGSAAGLRLRNSPSSEDGTAH